MKLTSLYALMLTVLSGALSSSSIRAQPPTSSPAPVLVGPFAERALQIVQQPMLHVLSRPEPVAADPKIIDWLIDHPQTAAALWQEVGLKVGKVEPMEGGWRAVDFDGSTADYHLVHRSPGLRIFYCKLTAGSKILQQTMQAEAVILHRVALATSVDSLGPTHQMEAFVAVKGPALQFVLKLARGAAARGVQQAVRETMLYFSLLARLTELRPVWAGSAASRFAETGVDPDARSLLELLPKRTPAPQVPTAPRSMTTPPAGLRPPVPIR